MLRESRRGLRRPPSAAKWRYAMPASGSDRASASPAKCGWRRDFGTVRTSACCATPYARRSDTKSSSVRVEWPTVNTVTSHFAAGGGEARPDGGRQNFSKAPDAGAKCAVLQDRREIQAIARARERDVEQALGLLALARARVLVGLRLVVGDGHRSLAARVCTDPDRRARAARAPPDVDDEDDRELEPLRGVHRHQADGVDRVDRGVRLVADGEPLQMIGNPRERRVAAILRAADHRAQLLQVLARLPPPRPAELV